MKFIPKSLNFSLSCFAIIAFGLAAFAQDAPKQETHGINVGNMDRSSKPGDNWYDYCNGDWLKRTEIPPDRSRIGVFSGLADLSDKRTASLIEEAAKSAGPKASKIADLYNSYMDEAGIEAKGMAPIEAQLKAIATINEKSVGHGPGEDPARRCGCVEQYQLPYTAPVRIVGRAWLQRLRPLHRIYHAGRPRAARS